MYDGKTQLLVANPLNRYLINSPMAPDLKKNADGSLTMYIQKDSPGAELESNWLPAPDGPIYVVMRLYWPKESGLKGTWEAASSGAKILSPSKERDPGTQRSERDARHRAFCCHWLS